MGDITILFFIIFPLIVMESALEIINEWGKENRKKCLKEKSQDAGKLGKDITILEDVLSDIM